MADNVSRALSRERGCSDCEHVHLSAEMTIKEQGVCIASMRDWKGVEVVDADCNAGPFLQGSMASVHDPRAHKQRYVHANLLVIQQTSRASHRVLRVRWGGGEVG